MRIAPDDPTGSMMTRVSWLALAALLGGCAVSEDPTRTDRFELVCQSNEPGVRDLHFNVLIYVNGSDVTDLSLAPPAEFPASTYVNAIVWSDGQREFSADRFSGILKIKPGSNSYSCKKIGGKKF